MYSHTDRDTRTNSERTYLFTDSTSLERQDKRSRDKGHNITADFRVLWNPDSFNTFEFRPNISLNYNKSASVDSSMTYANADLLSPVNKSYNTGDSHGNSFNIGGRLIYTHKVPPARDVPSPSWQTTASATPREKDDSYSRNIFYLFNDSTDIYDQYSDNHTWSNSVSTRLSWTEPLGDVAKGNFLTLEYRFSYRWNNADKLTYDILDPLRRYDMTLNEDLSNRFRNDFMENSVRVGYRHVSKNGNLNVGVSLVPQSSEIGESHQLRQEHSEARRRQLRTLPALPSETKQDTQSSGILQRTLLAAVDDSAAACRRHVEPAEHRRR